MQKTEILRQPKWQSLSYLLLHTHEKPLLLAPAIAGLVVAFLLIWMIASLNKKEFEGAAFKNFLRGTRQGL